MKKMFLTAFIGFLALGSVTAQEYRLAKSTGHLLIKLHAVTVEGYEGNEIVFSTEKKKVVDERAEGLRLLSGTGIADNTDIGINVTEKGSTIEVNEVSEQIGRIKIRVPKGIRISYAWQNMMFADKAIFTNIQNEIDITALNNSVELKDITGPVTGNTVYGSIFAGFGEKINGPVTLSSMYGSVDVSIPLTTRADLKLNTSYGTVLAAPEFKIELKKRAQDEMIEYSKSINGSMNGGGTALNLTAQYGKIYLRKKN